MPAQYTRRDMVRVGAALGFALAFGESRMDAQTRLQAVTPASRGIHRAA